MGNDPKKESGNVSASSRKIKWTILPSLPRTLPRPFAFVRCPCALFVAPNTERRNVRPRKSTTECVVFAPFFEQPFSETGLRSTFGCPLRDWESLFVMSGYEQ